MGDREGRTDIEKEGREGMKEEKQKREVKKNEREGHE